MHEKKATSLSAMKEDILHNWEKRCLEEVPAAGAVNRLALRDSLPLYIDHLSEIFAMRGELHSNSKLENEGEASRIGRIHGADRAQSKYYNLNQVIFEYHILRKVIFETLESEGELNKEDRDLILDSIEQAVNSAAVEFSREHVEIQQQFINTLTHDLKNPITSAKLSAQLILHRNETPSPAKESAKRILGSMTRLEYMIDNLLDASRIRAGEALNLKYEQCDLETIASHVIEEMSFVHGDRFRLDLLDPKETFEGDWPCDGIRRALENLVGNAVKYSTSHTPISILLRKKKDGAEITVHNFGNPIPKEEILFLFRQFKRSKSAEEGPKLGWGLGLTLVKGVMDACHGKVKVVSSQQDGTGFTLEVPTSTTIHRSSDEYPIENRKQDKATFHPGFH